jgi:hypothetical protein
VVWQFELEVAVADVWDILIPVAGRWEEDGWGEDHCTMALVHKHAAGDLYCTYSRYGAIVDAQAQQDLRFVCRSNHHASCIMIIAPFWSISGSNMQSEHLRGKHQLISIETRTHYRPVCVVLGYEPRE